MRTYSSHIILASLLVAGCGTITTQLRMNDRGRCPDPRNGEISSPVFSGTVYDVRGIRVPPGDRAHLYDIFFLIDLPLSAVADTLILPYTLSRSSDRDSASDRATEAFPRKYYGFAVRKLNDSRWFSVPEQQQPNAALFRVPSLSRTHTVFASASCERASFKGDDIKKLKDAFDAKSREVSDQHEFISCVSSISTRNGRECVVYCVKVLDKAPRNSPTPLVMTFDGFFLVHPDSDRLVVDAFVSERGIEAEIGKGTEALRKDFLESIEIRSIIEVRANNGTQTKPKRDSSLRSE